MIDDNSISFAKLGDMAPSLDKGAFKNLKIPNFDYLIKPKLLLSELKYVFIGYEKNTAETPLYIFDLFSRKFTLIAENVKDYEISPDRRSIAFIKKFSGKTYEDRLFIEDMSSGVSKELAKINTMSGLSWSCDSTWIAYSGSERSVNDIWIIRADGSASEELTNGINASSKVFWSRSGNKIAFSTDIANSVDSKVYIAKLNLADAKPSVKAAPPLNRKVMSSQLLDLLRRETK